MSCMRQGCSQIACRVQDASEEDESVPATMGLIRVVDAWIGSGVSASLAGPYQVSEGPLRYVGAEQSFGPTPSASSRSRFLVAASAWSGACRGPFWMSLGARDLIASLDQFRVVRKIALVAVYNQIIASSLVVELHAWGLRKCCV